MKKRHYNIPIFIPELACPFQCVYCDQKKITGQKNLLQDNEIIRNIESHLESFKATNREVQLAFFGGTFTGLNIAEQEHYLNLIQPYIHQQSIQGIRISTRPDYINSENLKLLKQYGVTHIELGAQSLVEEVLQASDRGHNVADVQLASEMILAESFILGLQMMIGLPADSPERSMQTAKRIVDFGAQETRIYPTIVIRGTNLEHIWQKDKYQALDTESAIEQSANLYQFFEKNKVKVLRVGLYPSDELSVQGEAVAGPEMPHFKEKVMSRIWKTNLNKAIDFSKKEKRLKIAVSSKEYNFAVGFEASNRKYLEEYFPKVKFIINSKLEGRNYDLVYY
ncbi:MAG: radical SAM protein [Bacteroidetes bacterium]|nr:MAG: radical SAM protein [Bacteroidota bacterium]